MKQYQFVKDTDENGKESISVSHKPKRRLDLIARLGCILAALIIWLAIVNFNQTDVTETMVLKINYVGLESLEGDGMMIYGMDKTEVTVTIKGSNRDIRKHEAEDYSIIADVSGISEAGTYTLPLTVKIPADSGVTVESDPSLNVSLICDLSAEKMVGFDVLVSTVQEGGLVSYAYESTQSASEILIKGPKQIIDTISSARFNANGNFVSSADEMTYSNFPLTFLDKNLNEVSNSGVVEYTTEEITVNVKATAHKTVPVEVTVKGSGADIPKTLNINTIEIWGVPSVVRGVKSYPIEVINAFEGMIKQEEVTSDKLAEGVTVKENIIIKITFEEKTNSNE